MLFEEVHKVYQFVVTQTVMAEVHDTLHRAFFRVLNHPAQVLQLQVGNTHMPDDTLSFQFMQCGQGLVNHLLQSAFHTALELNVVNVDNVDIVDVQALQTLVDTLFGTFGRVIPGVDTILAIATNLRRQVEPFQPCSVRSMATRR